ncbi:MAG: hypothetical protein JJU41_07775 [Bacteroidetes bacterium]|nr:hypothetical protein [Bacteroidota bacterium]MCH8524240.1 hypothetical protein [Balneolales bacterium]
MDWLSNNALFKDRLIGKRPNINLEKAKSRLFERLHNTSAPSPLQSQIKSVLSNEYTSLNEAALTTAEMD